MLKETYKQIPKHLLMNKWDLVLYVSKEVYNKEKRNIYNFRFLGIKVEVNGKD